MLTLRPIIILFLIAVTFGFREISSAPGVLDNAADWVKGAANDTKKWANQAAVETKKRTNDAAEGAKIWAENVLNEDGSKYEWYERVGIIVGGAVGGAVLLPIMVPLGLMLLGFTCCGVMAGSAAACCQSKIGNVESGSWFACCQSCATGGPCMKVYLIILGISGAILGGYIAFISTASLELVPVVTTQTTEYLTDLI